MAQTQEQVRIESISSLENVQKPVSDVPEESPSWETIGRRKRESIFSLLPEAWRLKSVPLPSEVQDATSIPKQHLSEREFDITQNYDADNLAKKIANGTFSAVEVTEAFCHRATIAHQLTNCLSEVLFKDAFTQASALDEHLRVHGKPVGPLHGVPISLKDQFRVRGVPTSVGFVSWLKDVETEQTESWLVQQLRALGAVVYCKTNVPTSLMAIETNNNIIGRTVNAWNREMSCGGSSGGEASLLAMRGSILGLGSDVGASIRLPCGYSDLSGLKPSHGRIPYLGIANSMEGHATVESVIGPMSHDIASLRYLFQLILSTKPWLHDPKALHLPWRSEIEEEVKSHVSSKSLTFAVLRTDGMVNPHPPVQRALDQTVSLLREQGYEVLEWLDDKTDNDANSTPTPTHAEAFGILWDNFSCDGGIDIHSVLAEAGEPPVPELSISYGTSPNTESLPTRSINDLWKVQARKYAFQTKYMNYWASTASRTKTGRPVDALICPVAPSTSHRPTEGRYFGYTGVFNVLDYAAVTVRTGMRVSPEDYPGFDGKPKVDLSTYQELNPFDKEVAGQWDPSVYRGMPIGLQVVCGRLEEEKVLTIAEEVQSILVGAAGAPAAAASAASATQVA